MSAPTTAMVMAAGLGLRMRPYTERMPKALVKVGGKTLIDHTLDRLETAGVTRAVVNVHAFADQMEAHLAQRRSPEILISDERASLLETGGGLKRARAMLGEAPIWVANSDYVWVEGGDDGLGMVKNAWDPARMDACLIVVPKERTSGFDTPGDFFIDGGGHLAHRGDAAEAPLHCFGIEIINPQRVYEVAADKFSLFQVWMQASKAGRLYGVIPDGFWMQVGDPAALATAEARLRETA
jgi:MurNAc alpha-1-phosphate uridylyltransferase